MKLVLSEAAAEDLRAITRYTVEQFGVTQARRMQDRFKSTLAMSAHTPGLGSSQEELDPPGHAFRYFSMLRRFIVVYEPTGDGIRVARVLHGARDLANEIARDAGDEEQRG